MNSNNMTLTTTMSPTRDEDPLQAATTTTQTTTQTTSFNSTEEMIEYLQKTQVVDMNDETMDPLEWSFRKMVPIPEHFYWDVVSSEEEQRCIPTRIRFWHRSLYTLSRVSQWTDDHIGQPLARTLGLHTPRSSDVTMFMSDDDWKRSQRIVMERQKNQEANEEEGRDPPLPDERSTGKETN